MISIPLINIIFYIRNLYWELVRHHSRYFNVPNIDKDVTFTRTQTHTCTHTAYWQVDGKGPGFRKYVLCPAQGEPLRQPRTTFFMVELQKYQKMSSVPSVIVAVLFFTVHACDTVLDDFVNTYIYDILSQHCRSNNVLSLLLLLLLSLLLY